MVGLRPTVNSKCQPYGLGIQNKRTLGGQSIERFRFNLRSMIASIISSMGVR